MTQTSSRRWDWYAAILLVAVLYTAAVRLSITNWTRELGYVESVVVLAGIFGLVLGISPLSGRVAGWLAGIGTILQLAWQMTRVAAEEQGVLEQLASSGQRLALTIDQLLAARRIEDPIFFILLMSLLYWTIGVYCGYRLVRGNRLLSVLIAPTVPLLVVQYYDAFQLNRLWIIAFYFFLVLLLIGRTHLLEKQNSWLSNRVSTSSQPEFELASSILAMAVAAIMLAWLLPGPATVLPAAEHAWQNLNQPFDLVREWVNNMLAAVRDNSGSGIETYRESMGLGNNASQGTREVFSVDPPPLDFPRYHWRARVYDTYADGVWNTSPSQSQDFTPERADVTVSSSSTVVGDFWFHWKSGPATLLALPSQPVWVSRAGKIEFTDAGNYRLDVLSWHTDLSVRNGDQYEAHAALLNPAISVLRAAGADYPKWVREHYLQVPADLPQEMRDLARDLTHAQPTPYDQANAVTEYLRSAIKYSPNVPTVPAGQEPLAWFLFTTKSGFCNYYASAEVMLLRSVGIPSRMAVGYSQGELAADGSLLIRDLDAHAWPEVYFPGIGWVDFEPTASQPDIVRAREPVEQTDGSTKPPAGQGASGPSTRPHEAEGAQNGNTIATYRTAEVWVIIAVALLVMAASAIWLLDPRRPLGRRAPQWVRGLYRASGLGVPAWLERWERWSNTNVMERSFHSINQSLAWLGRSQPAHVTPSERANLLKELLPSLAEEIDILKEQHEHTLFGPNPGDPAKAARAAWKIRSLTIRIVLRRFVGAKNE